LSILVRRNINNIKEDLSEEEHEIHFLHVDSLDDDVKVNVSNSQNELQIVSPESEKITQLTLENGILSELIKNNNGDKVTDLFESTLEQLNAAMECKILCEPLVDPVILKSGNTVSGGVLKDFERDPFDNTKDCKERIPNLLAKEVSEIIKNAKDHLSSILNVNLTTQVKTQTQLSLSPQKTHINTPTPPITDTTYMSEPEYLPQNPSNSLSHHPL